MALRWYVVHAYSNFEHRVKASLEEAIDREGMQAQFGEVLVPTEEVVEMRDGQQKRSERKFFPGYVLVQMELGDDKKKKLNNYFLKSLMLLALDTNEC